MIWITLIVFVAFLAIVVMTVPRVLRVFRGNRWIRIAVIDPESGQVRVRRDRGFEEFDGPVERLPVAFSSAEWYGGKIQHLPMAWIQAQGAAR